MPATLSPPARGDCWFRRTTAPLADRRLFCLPYAGGSARIYRNWHDWLAPAVEVVAIELPGRGVHVGTEPIGDMTTLVNQLAAAIEPLLDRPFAVFGHSMGGLVAFELTMRLVRAGYTPEHLFVSAMRPPHLVPADAASHLLPDAEFLDVIRGYEGTPPEVMANRELLDLILPVLRADMRVVETYRFTPRPPLSCPITALGGTHDSNVTRDDLDGWDRYTRGPVAVRLLPGNHFFLHAHEHVIAASIAASLRAATPATDAVGTA